MSTSIADNETRVRAEYELAGVLYYERDQRNRRMLVSTKEVRAILELYHGHDDPPAYQFFNDFFNGKLTPKKCLGGQNLKDVNAVGKMLGRRLVWHQTGQECDWKSQPKDTGLTIDHLKMRSQLDPKDLRYRGVSLLALNEQVLNTKWQDHDSGAKLEHLHPSCAHLKLYVDAINAEVEGANPPKTTKELLERVFKKHPVLETELEPKWVLKEEERAPLQRLYELRRNQPCLPFAPNGKSPVGPLAAAFNVSHARNDKSVALLNELGAVFSVTIDRASSKMLTEDGFRKLLKRANRMSDEQKTSVTAAVNAASEGVRILSLVGGPAAGKTETLSLSQAMIALQLGPDVEKVTFCVVMMVNATNELRQRIQCNGFPGDGGWGNYRASGVGYNTSKKPAPTGKQPTLFGAPPPEAKSGGSSYAKCQSVCSLTVALLGKEGMGYPPGDLWDFPAEKKNDAKGEATAREEEKERTRIRRLAQAGRDTDPETGQPFDLSGDSELDLMLEACKGNVSRRAELQAIFKCCIPGPDEPYTVLEMGLTLLGICDAQREQTADMLERLESSRVEQLAMRVNSAFNAYKREHRLQLDEEYMSLAEWGAANENRSHVQAFAKDALLALKDELPSWCRPRTTTLLTQVAAAALLLRQEALREVDNRAVMGESLKLKEFPLQPRYEDYITEEHVEEFDMAVGVLLSCLADYDRILVEKRKLTWTELSYVAITCIGRHGIDFPGKLVICDEAQTLMRIFLDAMVRSKKRFLVGGQPEQATMGFAGGYGDFVSYIRDHVKDPFHHRSVQLTINNAACKEVVGLCNALAPQCGVEDPLMMRLKPKPPKGSPVRVVMNVLNTTKVTKMIEKRDADGNVKDVVEREEPAISYATQILWQTAGEVIDACERDPSITSIKVLSREKMAKEKLKTAVARRACVCGSSKPVPELTVETIHGSLGTRHPHVIVTGIRSSHFPCRDIYGTARQARRRIRTVQDETKLLYVGCSRAGINGEHDESAKTSLTIIYNDYYNDYKTHSGKVFYDLMCRAGDNCRVQMNSVPDLRGCMSD